jgi:hypothetical protein
MDGQMKTNLDYRSTPPRKRRGGGKPSASPCQLVGWGKASKCPANIYFFAGMR